MPSGRVRFRLHEKGKSAPREVELPSEHARALRLYVERINSYAAERDLPAHVAFDAPTPVWLSEAGNVWSDDGVRSALAKGCEDAGVPRITPHAFRRAFATDAASLLPRHVVALAGGWQGVERLDNSYVHPRKSVIWDKLSHTHAWEIGPQERQPAHASAIVPA
jgi:integrase